MQITKHAVRLCVFVGETDTYHHRPLYHEIIQRARKAGLSGASVFRGIDGFGTSHRIHPHGRLRIIQEPPVVVVIIDDAERIRAFVPQIDQLITGGLITTDPVDTIAYSDKPEAQLLRY